jgi:protocatechuate 3,4-dioxygenase beta subunit
MSDHPHNHDHGLTHDLGVLNRQQINLDRRRLLRWAAGLGLLPFVGSALTSACGESGADPGASADSGTGGTTGGGPCTKIPEETGGPYPGDGSNGPNVLNQSGIVRSDIRSSFGSSSGTAAGVPLTVSLTIVSADGGSCAPLAGYAVYIWHCDQVGRYSLYSPGVTDQNYLRGVQVTDAGGKVSFTTIFPGCYSGRWPHIHFEVYPSQASATAAGAQVATSQLALPQANCSQVYATAGYEASVANLAQISLASDMVFSDGASAETPTVTGSTSAGYSAALTVAVAA